jgi:hypothetical protein
MAHDQFQLDKALVKRNRLTGIALLLVVLGVVVLTYVCRTSLYPIFFKL